MTTDHSDLIDALRRGEFKAHKLTSRQTEKLLGMAADALEALTTERTITINDTAMEAGARELVDLEEGEPWPTNEELGGSMTGTRDDELRDGARERAAEILTAIYAAQNPEGGPRG